MKKYIAMLLCCFTAALLSTTAQAQMLEGPFTVEASLEEVADGDGLLVVEIEIPEDHYLYADKFNVEAAGKAELEPVDNPEPKTKYDEFLEEELEVYDKSSNFTYQVVTDSDGALEVTVDYQGCGPNVCFPPETSTFKLSATDAPPTEEESEPALEEEAGTTPIVQQLDEFEVRGKASGYLDTKKFIDFLDKAESGEFVAGQSDGMFAGKGMFVIILLILAGGIALNLTPCVLPMIPVNIAIIGAGAQAKSKTRGFLLGSMYGLGIAMAYGILGLLVVLTGARFGALNSSPWFNFGIAILFVVLALSMFGLFNFDLSRFQGGTGTPSKGGPFITAFALGVVAAVLAGACVAPVVISVLLYSATLYAEGNFTGLILPFLLGVGMAIPWPFAGAGLSFLPKAGAWMEKVKYAFGVIILIAAAYYGRLGFSLLQSDKDRDSSAEPVAEAAEEEVENDWFSDIDKALAESRREQKPIFIDFWAEWCKSCLKMDKTTFKDPEVRERLDSYVKLKVDGDRTDSATELLMDRYVEVGLPTYVVLEPKDGE